MGGGILFLNVESRILNVQVTRAFGATDTQLRQRRRKFCAFYIQSSTRVGIISRHSVILLAKNEFVGQFAKR